MIAGFLEAAGWPTATRAPLVPDASARRHERLTDGARSAVLMAAPTATTPERDSIAAFRRIGEHLRNIGLSAPEEYAADPENGLILMEDFGDLRLSHLIETDDPRGAEAYACAAAGLAHIANAPPPTGLADPGATGLSALVELTFSHLTDAKALRATLLTRLTDTITEHAPGAPTLSLRDVHGDNLMWCAARSGLERIGWLDYQDALLLPAGYDLASLLDDPRRTIPDALAEYLITEYSTEARFAVLSLARNLRVLGIFHQLATRSGKLAYRTFLPRTRALVAARAEGFPTLRAPVAELLDRTEAWLP